MGRDFLAWLGRTPVMSFIVIPLAVVAFEFVLHRELRILPWGVPLLIWGYGQYVLCGRYRLPRAGGSSGMQVAPDRIIETGPYRYTRNPMYLGHLIFTLGLAVTFWSWFALIVLAIRAVWFHRRILRDEARLQAKFGAPYEAYRARVKRWIPGVL